MFFANRLPAQFIFTSKKPVSIFRTSIDKYELIQLKDSIPFSHIRIIDSRFDTTGIGFYMDGYLVLNGTSQPAALQNIMEQYYSRLYKSGTDTLIIQLEKLSIQDKVILESGFIATLGTIKASFYRGKNNVYQCIGSADTLLQESYDFEKGFKPHKNGNHTNYEFWDYYLLRLLETMILKASADYSYGSDSSSGNVSVDEIRTTGLTKREIPILKADSLRPGFYRNFLEFESNNPTFNFVNAEALKNVLAVMHYRVGKEISNEEPDTSYWGLCTGKKIFIRYKYNFFQVSRRDGEFYITPTLDARRREMKEETWNLIIGLAALGGGIAAGAGPQFSGFNALQAPEIPMVLLKSGDYPVLGLQLDWDTGNITW
jgi:hypothetical protein